MEMQTPAESWHSSVWAAMTFFRMGGDDLDMLPDIVGEGVNVVEIQYGIFPLQCDVHGLPFLPVLPIAQHRDECYRVSRNALILSSCSGVALISKW